MSGALELYFVVVLDYDLNTIYIRQCNVIIRKYGKLVKDDIPNIINLREAVNEL